MKLSSRDPVAEEGEVSYFYFWATPIHRPSPCYCRAVYQITAEDGHLVYCLQPGTLEILTSQTETGNTEDLKEPAAEQPSEFDKRHP